MKITKLEAQCLNNIARNIYASTNGGRPTKYTECSAWSWALTDDNSPDPLPKRSCPGVVASLLKKELVWCTDSGTKDAAVSFTELGFQVWLEHFPPEADTSLPPGFVAMTPGLEKLIQNEGHILSDPADFGDEYVETYHPFCPLCGVTGNKMDVELVMQSAKSHDVAFEHPVGTCMVIKTVVMGQEVTINTKELVDDGRWLRDYGVDVTRRKKLFGGPYCVETNWPSYGSKPLDFAVRFASVLSYMLNRATELEAVKEV